MWLSDAKPGFTFVKTSQRLPVKRIFFTDIDQMWYMNGVRGIGDRISDVVDFLVEVIRVEKIERVIFAGDSAGGYAAILFGILTEADCILAFSPQTNLSHGKYTYFKERITKIRNENKLYNKYIILSNMMSKTHKNTHISVHYSKYHPRDHINAKELSGFQNVELVGYPMFTHTVPSALKSLGHLDSLFELTLRRRTSYRIKLSMTDKISIAKHSFSHGVNRMQSIFCRGGKGASSA